MREGKEIRPGTLHLLYIHYGRVTIKMVTLNKYYLSSFTTGLEQLKKKKITILHAAFLRNKIRSFQELFLGGVSLQVTTVIPQIMFLEEEKNTGK